MNLSPASWFRRKSAAATHNQGGAIVAAMRQASPMGVWQKELAAWEPRAVNPHLYEALKEAIPMLDGGISRLVTLDGIIGVEGGSDRITRIIAEWMENVPVNDLETGFQAMYASQGEELYEQGIGVAEFVFDAKGREVIGLRVADSKGIGFVRGEQQLHTFYRPPSRGGDRRADGLGNVEQILRGNACARDMIAALTGIGCVELEPSQCMFALHRPEADNPYGTSVLRSLPFVAQILLRLQNSTARLWERYGDPSFHVGYKTANRQVDFAEASKRAQTIAGELGRSMAAKATGNSVDIATGVGKDDDITIDVIGAVGEALEIEMPARHMIEQCVAGFGFPAWMLGVSWAQAAGIAEPQAELVIQDAKTRFARRKQGLRRPVEAMLRGRGITWKAGDWDVVQTLPNLHDEVKRAQAEFLREQARMMRGGEGGDAIDNRPRGLDNTLRTSRPPRTKSTKAAGDDDGEPRAEPDPALPALETSATEDMLGTWTALRDDVLRLLGLTDPTAGKATKSDDEDQFGFTFDRRLLTDLVARGNRATSSLASELLRGQTGAWDRGIANAGLELIAGFDSPEVQAAIVARRAEMRAHYADQGLSLVRGGMSRRYESNIVGLLSSGAYDGQNPVHVAADLQRRFGGGEDNWVRLARSEVTWAQAEGKLDGYREAGITQYDYETAEDAKVSRICRDLAAAGPYDLNDASSPIPLRDSHPNCRCSVRARQ